MPDSAVADAIMHVMTAAFDPAFGEAWSRSQLLAALILPETRAVLIDDTGNLSPRDYSNVVGFALLRRVLDEEELLLIAIAPEARGKGFGGRLLDRCVETSRDGRCAKIFLEMRDDNPARHLYHAHGFKAVGLRRDYYTGRDGKRRNAITFMRIL